MNFEDSWCQQMVTRIAISPSISKSLNSVNTGSAVMIWWGNIENILGIMAWGQILRDSEFLHYVLKAGCWKNEICDAQVGGVWSKYCFPFSLLFICFLWHKN